MKDSENKKPVVRVTENAVESEDVLREGAPDKAERLKKPLIFGLMGIVFAGCMYLIFKPSSDKKNTEDIGLNDAVPQAADAGLPSDKQKAYQEEMLKQKMQQKRNALLSLADYWNKDSTAAEEAELPGEDYQDGSAYRGGTSRNSNPALYSYRNAQSTLSSFYDENENETQELKKQIEKLQEQLAEKQEPTAPTVEDQLELMERSYQMAARYLPSNAAQSGQTDTPLPPATASAEKEHVVAFTPARKTAVSHLRRGLTDSVFSGSGKESRNRGFYTAVVSERVAQPKSSIRAVVQQTQTVTDQSDVRLRLLETAQTPGRTIPAGTMLTANARFENGRLQLKVTSIELEGNIIPVDITAYDLDGQQGLYVPDSQEMNALTEIASNMSQTSGTSIMMTRSAGQQAAGDLSRGVVQGVSGYFSRKLRMPKVTVKAGHRLLLVSKN